ncbi:MAG: Valine--tRNA ligase [Microgenomates group bacterium ADurb.Bin219]|nr:MAG: Valine--tRNA ligase [Microgenomates group bacterium ADurb.Bin219]HNP89133.1 valine--tRNA ligase [Candidatus Woesebacteria bacterium]
MEKVYQPAEFEEKIYSQWEEKKYFSPKIDRKNKNNKKNKSFTIILPPPNANAPLHMGHAMYVIEDILCRYRRMTGRPTLFLPGTDHAGIETQFVFEKKLKSEGKSRFDFDRETLFQMIWNFVEENRGTAKKQMKKLGFSLDWSREKYTLNPEILKTVLATFNRLHQDGLIYRQEKMVNYCTRCGTAFSDLEVVYEERKDPLFYLKYGPFVLATTRPETKFGDTAVAVHPQDKRYKKLIGTEFIYQSLIGPKKMKVVADEAVDPKFGTGAVKVTPAHDPTDFEIGQRHHLPIIKVIGLDGRLTDLTGRFAGLKINEARERVVNELQAKGDLVKIDEQYTHRIGLCYRCKNVIEPMVIPQWFVKIEPLAKPAIAAVKKNQVKIFPNRFKKIYLNWMENIRDWNISRQIVWGPRIPAWYCLDCNPNIKISFLDKSNGEPKIVTGFYKDLKKNYSFDIIQKGLQSLTAPVTATYEIPQPKRCSRCQGQSLLQETDTFDTWFSSGQWPLTTLGYPDSEDFKYFYPTSVLDTMWDILFFWVARMIMFGLYLTGEVPFEIAHMHSRVVDIERKKMSKSKGNVIDPLQMVEKYGADALRMALVFGTAPASDIVVTEEKIKAMRNFANKIWNASRFVLNNPQTTTNNSISPSDYPDDQWILAELEKTIKAVTKNIESYHFGQAAEEIYEFFWHKFCDQYIEMVKPRLYPVPEKKALDTLNYTLGTSLKLLHPFMPFITEAIWQIIPDQKDDLIVSRWPVAGKEKDD